MSSLLYRPWSLETSSCIVGAAGRSSPSWIRTAYRRPPGPNNPPECRRTYRLLVRGDDPVQPVGIPGDAVLQHGEVVFTPFIGARRDENASRAFVPLRGEEFVAGADAVGPAVVDDPVEQGALLATTVEGRNLGFTVTVLLSLSLNYLINNRAI